MKHETLKVKGENMLVNTRQYHVSDTWHQGRKSNVCELLKLISVRVTLVFNKLISDWTTSALY